MKVRLNLATTPLETHRRFYAGAGIVGTVALVAFLWLSFTAHRSWEKKRRERSQLGALQREMEELQRQRRDLEAFFSQPSVVPVRQRAAYLNGLIEQRSFPWTKIFMDLERILPDGVRVISISPKLNNGRVEVKLTVGALADEGKLKFLRALESSKEFSRIQVLTESRPKSADQTDKVLLDLVAWYSAS